MTGSTYAVANLAGSAGKTTTVTTIAVLLAQSGFRVRVVDLDSQANASTWLGWPHADGITVADLLRRAATVANVERPARIIQGFADGGTPIYSDSNDPTDPDAFIQNLTILPAARSSLDKLVVELPAINGGVMHLRDALDEAEPVDVTLIDCPGSLNVLVLAGLLATSISEEGSPGSWGAITCTKLAGKEAEGIPALFKELRTLKKTFRIDIPVLSIVPCIVPPRGAVYREQSEDLIEAFGDLVAPPVRQASAVDAAYTNYVPVPLFGYKAKDVIHDYQAVVSHMQSQGLFQPTAVSA